MVARLSEFRTGLRVSYKLHLKDIYEPRPLGNILFFRKIENFEMTVGFLVNFPAIS